jgi:DNA-nicking Smr family endonuclease
MINDTEWNKIIKNIKPLKTKRKFSHTKSKKPFTSKNLNILQLKSTWKSALKQSKFDLIIDLHGMTVEEAYNYLSRSIKDSYLRNNRTLLIITGKGSLNKPSILQQELPRWLTVTEISNYILQYEEAKQEDGGKGAKYVVLKRMKQV